MKLPLKIGLTGGIGSGKSTVCRLLAQVGVPSYGSDEHARRLMQHSAPLKEAIVAHFGAACYLPSGELNRPHLAAQLFGDGEQLALLNSLVHPAVQADFAQWAAQSTAPYVVEESAILFESGAAERMDRVVVVTAPEALRLQRTVQRDATSEEAVRARMARQMSEEERVSRAHYLLRADDTELLIPQVLELHQTLLTLCHSK